MELEDETKKYETGHIQKLKDESVRIQKKTYTKWINSYLIKEQMKVNDLFKDLSDGKILIKLMEIISGERLGKPNRGLIYVQKVENVNKALFFIKSKVILENIGAEDIVDGNQRLILGLIWTIILRWQIQNIQLSEEQGTKESGAKRSAKEALLLWCQRKTKGYKDVNLTDFSKSWRDGMGFNALIHSHCPDLIDIDHITPKNANANLANAFDVADTHLGVPKLLDPEDVNVDQPDDKSIMTYVSSLYHTFAKMKTESTGAKRIGKIVGNAMDVQNMVSDYQKMVSDLLAWVNKKIVELQDRRFPNSVEGVQHSMQEFKKYRTEEKPPKYKERSNIDDKLFNLLVKQKENGLKKYVPPEGFMLKDIENAWSKLEKAEHEREMALRSELLRQERLDREAKKFRNKANIREVWLGDMRSILKDLTYGNDSHQVEASLKKQEAISAEIHSKKDRFDALSSISDYLGSQNYEKRDQIRDRNTDIQRQWSALRGELGKREEANAQLSEILSVMRELENIQNEHELLEPSIKNKEFGKHLMAANDLLERHMILESQIQSLNNRVKRLRRRADPILESPPQLDWAKNQCKMIDKKLHDLEDALTNTDNNLGVRRNQLEQNKQFHQIWVEMDAEEAWLTEKTNQMNSKDVGKDLQSLHRLLRKHELQMSEISARRDPYHTMVDKANQLINSGHYAAKELTPRLTKLETMWDKLAEAMKARKKLLEDALESQQYYADADDVEQWLQERMPLVTSKDYGKDESGTRALANRHSAFLIELQAFGESDIKRLQELSTLMTQSADKHNIRPEQVTRKPKRNAAARDSDDSDDDSSDIDEEMVEITVEEEVEETVMKEVMKEVDEVKEEDLVQVMCTYKARDPGGRDLSVKQGDTLVLLGQTTPEWWNVRNNDNKRGYVPANYLRRLEPRKILRKVRKPVEIPVKMTVKKPVLKRVKKSEASALEMKASASDVSGKDKNWMSVKNKLPSLRRTASTRLQNDLHFDRVNVESRQNDINKKYELLCALSKTREEYLKNMMKMNQFLRECGSFEDWMKHMEKQFERKDRLSHDVDAAKKRYEELINELAANSGRLENIKKLADDLLKSDLPNNEIVKKRLKEVILKLPDPIDKEGVADRVNRIQERWDKLDKMKSDNEKSLAGASSVELFTKTCDEAKDWISEKMNILEVEDVGLDQTSNEVLKRRHQNLQREMVPIEEKMNRVHYLGQVVKSTYPEEEKFVNEKTAEVDDLWDKLKKGMRSREAELSGAGNRYQFGVDSREMDSELDSLLDKINSGATPRDVKEAKALKRNHKELQDEVKALKEKFNKLIDMGDAVLKENPNDKRTAEKIEALKDKMKGIDDAMKKREKALEDALKAQEYFRECDQIESLMSQHEKMLKVDQKLPSVEDVDRAKKAHLNLKAMMDKQKDRVGKAVTQADDMIDDEHPETEKIEARRTNLVNRQESLDNSLKDHWNKLEDALKMAKLLGDVDEMREWIHDKSVPASEENYRDLNNLPNKHKRHAALVAEVNANKKPVEDLIKTCEAAQVSADPNSKQLASSLEGLKNDWANLLKLTEEKSEGLNEAEAQSQLNKDLADAEKKLDNIEKLLSSKDVGSDLESTKNLLQKHKNLEDDLANQDEKIKDLIAKGKELADANHFNKDGIMEITDLFERRMASLLPRVAERKKQLDDSLLWHQLAADFDQEHEWIQEHKPLAALVEYGRNYGEASTLLSKHKNLMQEISTHKPTFERVLQAGKDLVKSNHFAKPQIEERLENLQSDWNDLENLAKTRQARLEASVSCQTVLNDVAELGQWVTVKSSYLNQMDKPSIYDTEKMLAKVKALELELPVYNDRMKDIQKTTEKLTSRPEVKNLVPEALEGVQRKCAGMEEKLVDLTSLCHQKKSSLEAQKAFYDYMNESDDFDEWVNERLTVAAQEEYGDDFEHLKILIEGWEDFKSSVAAGKNRYEACDSKANSLISSHNPMSEEILLQQQRVRSDWELLLSYVDARDHKLAAAGEIHKFNQKWSDVMDRIDEKMLAIPSEIGRDSNILQRYEKRHEAFEVELVTLEQQVQDLIDEASELINKYPGGNAQAIQGSINETTARWDLLQKHTEERRQQLADAHAYYQFCNEIRILLNWYADVIREAQAEQPLHDSHAADDLLDRYKLLKKELNDRESLSKQLLDEGESMCDNGHFASDDIQNKLDQMLNLKQQATDLLNSKLKRMDGTKEELVILHDIALLNAASTQQEARINSAGLGSDVEEVEKLLEKQNAVEKLMSSYDDKLEKIRSDADDLIDKKHFDAPKIKEAKDDCVERRTKARQACTSRRNLLENQLSYLRFLRDIGDCESWLDEKAAQLSNMDGEARDLEEKLRMLQKHQALEAEVLTNEKRFDTLESDGKDLIKKKHPHSKEIEQKLNATIIRWKRFKDDVAKRSILLEEAKDLLTFNEEVETVETWIREKELLVSAGDLGDDLEHCQALQNKLTETVGGKQVDEPRITAINNLAKTLMAKKLSDSFNVKNRADRTTQRWEDIQSKLADYRKNLNASEKLHRFNRDADTLHEQIKDRIRQAKSDNLGSSLNEVQKLLRKQDGLDRDIVALQEKTKHLEKEGRDLLENYPDIKPDKIMEKIEMLQKDMAELQEASQKRKSALNTNQKFYRLIYDIETLCKWVDSVSKDLDLAQPPTTLPEWTQARMRHNDLEAEVTGRQIKADRLKENGNKLVEQKHPKKSEIEAALKKLANAKEKIKSSWHERNIQLDFARKLIEFLDHCDRTDAWLDSISITLKEKLESNDLSSVGQVEAGLRQLESLDLTLVARDRQDINGDIAVRMSEIVAEKNYGAESAMKRFPLVQEHLYSVQKQCQTNCDKLNTVLRYHNLLRQANEQLNILRNKMKLVTDPSGMEPTNLKSKIKKHETFISEIESAISTAENVAKETETYPANAPGSGEVKQKGEDLRQLINGLKEACKLKSSRLDQSYQYINWQRKADDFEKWIQECESEFGSDNYGSDSTSVKQLLNKHKQTEESIETHKAILDSLKSSAEKMLKEKDHVHGDDISSQLDKITKHFSFLPSSASARHRNLDEAAQLYQFVQDVNDELAWIKETMPIVTSTETGASVEEVAQHQKKLFSLESAQVAHEHLVKEVGRQAEDMIAAEHYASADVKNKWICLKESFRTLQDTLASRKERLSKAMQLYLFLNETTEACDWLNENRVRLVSEEGAKNEEAVLAHLKKLDALELDLETFSKRVSELEKKAGSFTSDKDIINEKMKSLLYLFSEFKDVKNQRRGKLVDKLKYFEYIRETDDIIAWIQTNIEVASQEENGRDLEHCEILNENFKDFVQVVLSSNNRINNNNSLANKLITEKNGHSTKIKDKNSEMNKAWASLREQIRIQKEALAGALQVHTLGRDIEDVRDRIEVKMVEMAPEETKDLPLEMIAENLESARDKEQRHAAVRRDMPGIERQIEKLKKESERLKELYPHAQDYINEEISSVERDWENLKLTAEEQTTKLSELVSLQSWLERYRELLSWIQDLLTRILSEDLARTLSGAQIQLDCNLEHKLEIEGHRATYASLKKSGKKLQSDGHYISHAIQERLDDLDKAWGNLNTVCDQRKNIYEENLDLRKLLSEISDLHTWLNDREKVMNTQKEPDNIEEVEEALKVHEDFSKAVFSAEPRFEAIRRLTLLEKAWKNRLEKEKGMRKTQESILNKERVANLKRKETQRLADEKRRLEDQALLNQVKHSPAGINIADRTDLTITPRPFSAVFATGPPPPTSPTEITPRKGVKKSTSFSTRKDAGPYRDRAGLTALPPASVTGNVERKHTTLAHNRKAPVRQWKSFYAALCGHLLAFFKDEKAFKENSNALHALSIYKATCQIASDYSKKKFVLRLKLQDENEYLLSFSSNHEMNEWLLRIQTAAQTDPAEQLKLDLDLSVSTLENLPSIQSPLPYDRSSVSSTSTSGTASKPSSPLHVSGTVGDMPDEKHHHHGLLGLGKHTAPISDTSRSQERSSKRLSSGKDVAQSIPPPISEQEETAAEKPKHEPVLLSTTAREGDSSPKVTISVEKQEHSSQSDSDVDNQPSTPSESSKKRGSHPSPSRTTDSMKKTSRLSMKDQKSSTLPVGASASEDTKKKKGISRLVPSFMKKKHDKDGDHKE